MQLCGAHEEVQSCMNEYLALKWVFDSGLKISVKALNLLSKFPGCSKKHMIHFVKISYTACIVFAEDHICFSVFATDFKKPEEIKTLHLFLPYTVRIYLAVFLQPSALNL